MIRLANMRGDTIVEVLIAVTVMSVILTGGFVTATRSQSFNRAAQERSEALKTVQSQVEGIKALLAKSIRLSTIDPPKCVKADVTGFIDSTDAQCKNINNLYNVSIVVVSADTYKITAQWNKIGGGNEQLEVYYRTYQ